MYPPPPRGDLRTYLDALNTLDDDGQFGLRFDPLDIIPVQIRVHTGKHSLADTLRIPALLTHTASRSLEFAFEPKVALTFASYRCVTREEDGVHVELVDLFQQLSGDVTLAIDVELEEQRLPWFADRRHLVQGTRCV